MTLVAGQMADGYDLLAFVGLQLSIWSP